MTKIITRAYTTEQIATDMADVLCGKGIPRRDLLVVAGIDAGTARQRLIRAQVPQASAETYGRKIGEGFAVLAVRATYKPLGAAQIVRDLTAASPTVDLGVTEQETEVPNRVDHAASVLKDHPRFLSAPPRSGTAAHSAFLPRLGHRPTPMPNTPHRAIDHTGQGPSKQQTPNRGQATPQSGPKRGGYLSQRFWPMPLVLKTSRTASDVNQAGPVFSKLFGWPTLLRR